SIDAWVTALEQFGTKSFSEVVQGALSLAEDGFPAHHLLCQTIAEDPSEFSRWPSSAAIFLPEGRPPRLGERFRQQDLGRTIRRLIAAEQRAGGSRRDGLAAVRKAFYEGEVAQDIVAFHEREGSWLSAADLRDFRVGIEEPVSAPFRDHQVFTC